MNFQNCTIQEAEVIFEKLEKLGFSKELKFHNKEGKKKYLFMQGEVKIKFDYDKFYLVSDIHFYPIYNFENIVNAMFYFCLDKKDKHSFNDIFFDGSQGGFQNGFNEGSFLYITDNTFLQKKEHQRRCIEFSQKDNEKMKEKLDKILFFEQKRNHIKEKLY